MMLSLAHLRRTYPGGHGVHDVTITVPAGAVYALVGANGAGKTTTLSVITGALRAPGGSLVIDGVTIPLDRYAPRPGIGFVGFDPVVDPAHTAWEWLGFVCAVKGVRPRTDALSWATGLALTPDSLDRPIVTLSEGNRRKVCLWIGAVTATRLLVLDEPTTALDPPAILALQETIRRLASEGRSVLLSTHLLPQAEEVATHVGILSAGRTVDEGPLAYVLAGSASLHERYFAVAGGGS